MLSDCIRRWSYWILDFCKGSPVKKDYIAIKQIIENNDNNTKQLKKILNYSINNVPLYRGIKESKLSEFPVVTKKDYLNYGNQLKSQEYINSNNLHHVSTSGSTGVPFKAVQDRIKRNRTIASLIYFHERAGFKLGYKYIFMRAWTSEYSSSKFRKFCQNFIPIEVVGFNEKKCEELRKLLIKDKKIKVILGYASALEIFVNYLYKRNDNYKMFNIEAILTGSDNLKPEIKEKLEKMFNCIVYDRYSNEEQGMIGMTMSKSSKFILNTANYYFEILKIDCDLPTEPGELGRLIITDLYNYAMPFIRYDTGDLVKTSDKTDQIVSIDCLEGRTIDLLGDTKGNKISAATINNYIHTIEGIQQYQVIQEEKKKYMILIVKTNDKIFEKEKCIDRMKKCLGDDAVIVIREVNDIPIGQNGKYKTVVKMEGI